MEAKPDWLAIELAMVKKLWLPDAEIPKLKSFQGLVVLDNLQVSEDEHAGLGTKKMGKEMGKSARKKTADSIGRARARQGQ